jgi:tRNA(adenine34) deaminase
MCSGAIIHARLDRVVYGATDPKAGAVRSLYQILNDERLNHAPEVVSGVLETETSTQLKLFFRELRQRLKTRSNCSD